VLLLGDASTETGDIALGAPIGDCDPPQPESNAAATPTLIE
jgi:hypothetical protein